MFTVMFTGSKFHNVTVCRVRKYFFLICPETIAHKLHWDPPSFTIMGEKEVLSAYFSHIMHNFINLSHVLPFSYLFSKPKSLFVAGVSRAVLSCPLRRACLL